MTHTTEIVEYKKLSDSEFAVLIRCCDPCAECKDHAEINYQCKTCHLHWHTMHSSVVVDPVKMNVSIQWARDLAATNHDASIQAEARIKAMIGNQIQHDKVGQ